MTSIITGSIMSINVVSTASDEAISIVSSPPTSAVYTKVATLFSVVVFSLSNAPFTASALTSTSGIESNNKLP